jgi:hypothetical protein
MNYFSCWMKNCAISLYQNPTPTPMKIVLARSIMTVLTGPRFCEHRSFQAQLSCPSAGCTYTNWQHCLWAWTQSTSQMLCPYNHNNPLPLTIKTEKAHEPPTMTAKAANTVCLCFYKQAAQAHQGSVCSSCTKFANRAARWCPADDTSWAHRLNPSDANIYYQAHIWGCDSDLSPERMPW